MQWHERLSFHACAWKRWNMFIKYVSDSKKWDFGDLHILKYVMGFKKWDYDQRHFKTCIGLQKVRFCLITCFKICNEHKNVLLCEENMFLLKKLPLLLITFDFLHEFEWNQLHSSCFGEVIILPSSKIKLLHPKTCLKLPS